MAKQIENLENSPIKEVDLRSTPRLPSSTKTHLFTSLKIVNLIYVIWACFVFASLSFFRPHGKNEFKGLTLQEIGLGALYALASFVMNFPMSYFFSFKMVEDLKKLFSREVFSYHGDWVFGVSAILGVLLGSLTTVTGMAISNLSLKAWAPIWFADPTTAVFSWNTFTTRSRSTLIMLSEIMLGIRRGFKNIFQITHLQEPDWVFQCVKDLERFKYQVRWLSVTRANQEIIEGDEKQIAIYQAGIQEFYNELAQKKLSIRTTTSEWTSIHTTKLKTKESPLTPHKLNDT